MAVSSSPIDIWNRALSKVGVTEFVQGESDDSLAARICRLHYDDILVEVLEAAPWSFARRQAVLSSVATASNSHEGNATGSLLKFGISFAFSSTSQISVTVDGVAQVAGTDYNTSVADKRVTFLLASIPADSAVILITGTFARAGWENIYGLPGDMVTPEALLSDDGPRHDLVAASDNLSFAIQAGETEGLVLLTDSTVADGFDKLEYIAAVSHVPTFPRQFIEAVAWRLAGELAPALKKSDGTGEMRRYLLALDAARADMLQQSKLGPDPQTPSIAARFDAPQTSGTRTLRTT